MAESKLTNKENDKSDSSAVELEFTINVTVNGDTVVFELNTSSAAKDLYGQLPLNISAENYGNNEKIFHPPEKLSTATTPLVSGARSGTLAYYAPWNNVVMFYGDFGSAPGLYELGHTMSGAEHIHKISGTISITKGAVK